MPRMRARTRLFRRLVAILCGVLMVHTSWMAATASCERHPQDAEYATAVVSATTTASAHGHHHAEPVAQLPAPVAPASHHNATSWNCPMAMACTLSVMTADVPVVTTRTVAIGTTLPTHVAGAPRGTVTTPEPPPPRA